jgi:hypothetical protein
MVSSFVTGCPSGTGIVVVAVMVGEGGAPAAVVVVVAVVVAAGAVVVAAGAVVVAAGAVVVAAGAVVVAAGAGAVVVDVGDGLGVGFTPPLWTLKCPRRVEVVPSPQVITAPMVCEPSASFDVSNARAVPSAAVPARSKGVCLSVFAGGCFVRRGLSR